jgi:hypothetical protein
VYVSYTELRANLTLPPESGTDEFRRAELTSKVPYFGLSFAVNDRVKLKGQFVAGETTTTPVGIEEEKFDFLGIAVSVRF